MKTRALRRTSETGDGSKEWREILNPGTRTSKRMELPRRTLNKKNMKRKSGFPFIRRMMIYLIIACQAVLS
jgi:hypothetical protein